MQLIRFNQVGKSQVYTTKVFVSSWFACLLFFVDSVLSSGWPKAKMDPQRSSKSLVHLFPLHVGQREENKAGAQKASPPKSSKVWVCVCVRVLFIRVPFWGWFKEN